MTINTKTSTRSHQYAAAATVAAVIMGSTGLVVLPSCAVPMGTPADSTSILFDGAEGTSSGTSDFSFGGANFSGGAVLTAGDPSLYGSGAFAYEVREGSTVAVSFDAPIDSLDVVFIQRGTGTCVLTAFDDQDNEVGTITAGSARTAQTVLLSANAIRIEVIQTGEGDGWIDNFTFRPAS